MAELLDHPILKQFKDEPLKKIESLLGKAMTSLEENEYDRICRLFIGRLMPELGHKDEPDFDEEGKPILLRTTALHHLARRRSPIEDTKLHGLFNIYNRFDLNYIDELSGITHLHVACIYGCEYVVQQFLDLGQDPNYPIRGTDHSPLHLALESGRNEVAELLLRSGADPTSATSDGSTALHFACRKTDTIDILFEANKKKYRSMPLDAQDKLGNTPLHCAMSYDNSNAAELLLRAGADPSLVNADGSTPLHIICSRLRDGDLAKVFFKISKELDQTVKIEALDKWGRTPLQLAVANILPNTVDVLLSNGADPSSFVFPADCYFGEVVDPPPGFEIWANFKLRLASGALLIVERLEGRGYELDRSDALTIMKFFAKLGLFQKSVDLQKRLSDDEQFAVQAKQIIVKSDLSLFDLIKLSPKEAKKQITTKEYFDFSILLELNGKDKEACLVHLCEKLSRDFFLSWTMDLFMELTHYRLSLLCCDKIFEHLNNEDLFNICMAATRQSS